MISIYILIMIIGGSTSQSGFATIQQEFNSFEKCEIARVHILSNLNSTSASWNVPIRTQGCFKK